jgi:hypothetical protein
MINLKIHNKTQKYVISLILAAVLLSSVFVATAVGFISGQSGVSGADFITMEGVAGNDYYDSRQYSYNINWWASVDQLVNGYPLVNPANMWFNASKSLRIGMTEYGEFATPANTGIAYGANSAQWVATESWASTAINQALYIQGWVFYLNYTRAAVPRVIESWAIYSDLNTQEAGRKVVSWDGTRNAGATGWSPVLGSLATSGVEILYDSARLGVARAHVIVHDGFYNEDVAKITFTVILNKDTKYMIIYKDIKMLIDPKVLDIINDFAFSERYEIDLARNLNPSNQAFIHYYQNYKSTVYQHPLTGASMYSALQAYDSGKNNIFFAAYWPNTTEYSVYSPLVPDLPTGSNTRVLPQVPVNDPLVNAIADIPPIPTGPGEPNTPWVIAQWRYQSRSIVLPNYYPNMLQFLAKGAQREIRFVEVAGMTDYNDPAPGAATSAYDPFRAMDAQDPAYGVNTVDMEVQFLLEQVFNPEDLTTNWYGDPYQWVGLGQSAATTDSAGSAVMGDSQQWYLNNPLGLFDRNDTMFPWTGGLAMKGTIPYALSNTGNFANYIETFSNTAKGTGSDSTSYVRTGLNGFAFFVYNGVTMSPPQPIAGGQTSATGSAYWYPSRNPMYDYSLLTAHAGRWSRSSGGVYTSAPYGTTVAEGIMTIGGGKANGISRYFNDFNFAITREGIEGNYLATVNGGTVVGSAPTSDGSRSTLDYFPLSTWASSTNDGTGFGYKEGYAVISIARDINGTRGLSVYGWDARDTYWASAWASQYAGAFYTWIKPGTTALILQISYSDVNREPTAFTVVKALGTITEFGSNVFATTYNYDQAGVTWGGTVVPPSLPSMGAEYAREWWFEKLPTTSIAKVDFDP